ncbi:DUF4339 domain-containing protein [Bythopirellula goksoeyrii]|uniref:GYF domain-containing protein n=1 Tax=Bythopirellula goksoeyrii TaxID=1400387 RepID=A0A5B9QII5_9BACT|nr:DUF4339 domain-containing protein [Bythopirellula goksoeyrii]QEG34041.1 hypothetical protein Pr1d_13130 [Bythopirellula goksoeyrii]
MGIRFFCPNGHKLNVKGFLAGKRGICPECDARFLVPMESGGRVEALEEPTELLGSDVPAPANHSDSLKKEEAHLADTDWHVRGASGAEQGPIPYAQVKAQIEIGQVDKDSWVWRTGWQDWQRAIDVFPEIESTPDGSNANTVKDIGAIPSNPETIVVEESGFVPQESVAVATHRRLQRERRQRARMVTLVLTVLICLLALVLGIILSR